MNNRSAGQSPEELYERAVAALVREYTGWGVTEAEARDVVRRNFVLYDRLGPLFAPLHAWPDDPPEIPRPPEEPVGLQLWALDQQRSRVIDLTAFDESVRSTA